MEAATPARPCVAHAEGADLLAELKEALKQRPNDVNLHIKLALAYHEAGRPDEAIRRLDAIANRLANKGYHKTALSVNGSLLKLAPWHQEAVSREQTLRATINLPKEIHGSPIRRTLLAGIPSDQLAQIATLFKVERYPAETPIIREAETGNKLYIMQSGLANVFVSDREHHGHRLATLREGDFFGEIAILTGCPRTATVQARQDSELWVLGYDECQRIMRAYPRVKELLYRTSEARMQETTRQVAAQGIERRIFPRVPTDLPGHIEFQPTGATSQGQSSVQVRVTDLSASGAGLTPSEVSDSILALCTKGTPVVLSFLVEHDVKISVGAQVERVRAPGRIRPLFVGVSFANVNQIDREKINKYITQALMDHTLLPR